jgi:hypothetical protein
MYSIRDNSGTNRTVKPTDRIILTDGITREYYITDIVPFVSCGIQPTLRRTVNFTHEPLTFSGGTVTAGTQAVLKGQSVFYKAAEHSKNYSPNSPCAKGHFLVKNASTSASDKLLQIKFTDQLNGKAFANTHTFARVTTTATSADSDLGEPGTVTPSSSTVAYLNIFLESQYPQGDNRREKIGDALVIVDKSAISRANLEGAAYFTITPQGGTAERYTIWNDDGIKEPITHQWHIYLQRMRQ